MLKVDRIELIDHQTDRLAQEELVGVLTITERQRMIMQYIARLRTQTDAEFEASGELHKAPGGWMYGMEERTVSDILNHIRRVSYQLRKEGELERQHLLRVTYHLPRTLID